MRGCASSDSAVFRAAYLRGALAQSLSQFLGHIIISYTLTQRLVKIRDQLSLRGRLGQFEVKSSTGFDIPAAWLSTGAGAIVATLNDEHRVQLPFAALATVDSSETPVQTDMKYRPHEFIKKRQLLQCIHGAEESSRLLTLRLFLLLLGGRKFMTSSLKAVFLHTDIAPLDLLADTSDESSAAAQLAQLLLG